MASRVIFFFTLLQLMCLPGDGQIVEYFTSLITRNTEPNQPVSFSGNQSPSYSGNRLSLYSGNQPSSYYGNQQVYYSGNSPPPSPCPQVFQYQYIPNEWTGQLSVPPSVGVDSNTRKLIPVKVEIQLVLPARLPNKYVGKLELAESNQMVWEKLKAQSRNNPIFYRVHFPLTSPLPYLTMVIVNGILLCSGSTDSFSGRVMTTITLNHTFYPYSNQQLNVGGSPSVSNIYIVGDNSRPSSTHNMGNQPQTVVVRPAPEINYNTGNADVSQHSDLVPQPVVEANRFTTPVTYVTRPTPTTTTTMVTMPSEPSAPRPVTQKPQKDNFSTNLPQASFMDGVPCGVVEVQASPLITYGQQTSKGQWPWHAAIYQSKGTDLSYICGGSLIGKKTVLTAAHCVSQKHNARPVDPETLVVYLGKYHLKLWSEGGVQDKQVRDIHMHPDYNSTDFRADIAVLVLSASVDFTLYVKPVCLWDRNRIQLSEVEGVEGVVVGWGYDERGTITEELMMAKMPVVSQQTCIWSYPQFFSHFTSDKTYCAGFRNGTSVCNGDSGGGMVFPKTSQPGAQVIWSLRGIVSLSTSQEDKQVCNTKHYVVFTDVAKFHDWIQKYR